MPTIRVRSRRPNRKGSILVMAAALMVPLCAILAFSIDLGHVYVEQAKLQNSADAAAAAAAAKMHESTADAQNAAVNIAELNSPNSGEVLQVSDIVLGNWDEESRQFVASTSSRNAAKVTCRRVVLNGNAVSYFFARMLGHDTQDLVAEAIALSPPRGMAFRFLIDDEMFDTDEKGIEDLARELNVTETALLSDNDGDGFIDLPPGSIIELPTGQVGDEALFDVASYEGAFPFKENSQYTTTDFLAEGTALENSLGTARLQDVEWNSSNAPHPDLDGAKLLDPTPGVDPVDNHSDIAALPDPDQQYVSPVFDDDISMAETDPSKYNAPAANLQGERRGLVAFRILSSRPNPAGGSYLPLLTIEILDPPDITTLPSNDQSSISSGGRVSLVN